MVSFSKVVIDRAGGHRFVVFIDDHQVGIADRSPRGRWKPGPVLADRFPGLRRHYHLSADLQDDVRKQYSTELNDMKETV